MDTASRISPIPGLDIEFLKHLYDRGGYYHCPREGGQLVGYAGKYKVDPTDPESPELQYVGHAFYNLALLEAHPVWLSDVVGNLSQRISLAGIRPARVIGLPMGGLAIASALALKLNKAYGFPDKIVDEVATKTTREKSHLAFARHTPPTEGEKIILVEDVRNNDSSTKAARELVESFGGEVIAIACIVDRAYGRETDVGIPVISHCHFPTPQFRQDDPAVADYVANNQVVWKPKDDWGKLQEIMRAAS